MALPNSNKTLARRYFLELLNGVNALSAHELLSDDFVFTLPTHPNPFRGPDGFIGLARMLHGSFPDFYIFPSDMVAGDDWVFTRWRGGGTHTGAPLVTSYGDIPASGRSFEIEGMTWHSIRDGKIVEAIGQEDTIGMMMQLGVIASPASARTEQSSEKNLALAMRFFRDIMSGGEAESGEEILDPMFQFMLPMQSAPIVGYDAFTRFARSLRDAFPDIAFTAIHPVCEGDHVAARLSMSGTHDGEFFGISPTGRKMEWNGLALCRIHDGKLTHVWSQWDETGMRKQLARH
jgi:steroid delta-isomerase-like uncharacterized protein